MCTGLGRGGIGRRGGMYGLEWRLGEVNQLRSTFAVFEEGGVRIPSIHTATLVPM